MNEDIIKARMYDALMLYLKKNNVMLSLAEARKAVGGQLHLDSLLSENEIREVDNMATKSNCKRLFPAYQVYSHIRRYNK